MSISAGIDQAIAGSPGLLSTPGLALDASSSSDPQGFGQSLTQAAGVTSTGQAISDSQTQDQPQTDAGGGGGIAGFFGHAAKWFGHQFQTLPGIHGAEHAVTTAAQYLSKPLHEIQRDYRFVHDVYAKQGILAGFLATAGLAGGAALGTLAGGNTAEGIVAAGYVERQLASAGILGQGWQQDAIESASPDAKISLGRDIASAIGDVPGLHTFHNTDTGFGKILSGSTDALADFTLDPVVMAAKLKTGMKLGNLTSWARDSKLGLNTDVVQDGRVLTAARAFLNGDLTRVVHSQALQGVIDNVAPGLKLHSPEQLASLYGPGDEGSGLAGITYRRFLDHVVKINATSATPSADIARLYPQTANLAFNTLKGSDGKTIIKGLASASTRAEANQVFMDVISKENFAQRMVDSRVLPTRTLTRSVGQQVAGWLTGIGADVTRAEQPGLFAGAGTATKQVFGGNLKDAADTMAAAAGGKIRTFTTYKAFAMNKATNALSTTSVPWTHGQGLGPGGYQAWLNVARYGMGDTNARYWLDQLQNAPSLDEARRITKNITFEAAKGMGLPDLERYAPDFDSQLTHAGSPTIGGPGEVYGVGLENGRDVSLGPHGAFQTQQALYEDQASGDLSFPNFEQMLLAFRQNKGAFKANFGKFDETASRVYTGPVFKTMALLNGGFALRVSLAEAIPQVMRVGVMEHLRSVVAETAASKEYKLAQGEGDHVLAATAHALSTAPIRATAGIMRRPLTQANSGFLHGLNVLLNDPARRDFAMKQVIAHGGHTAIGAATTSEAAGGYGYDSDPSTRAAHGAHLVKSEYKDHPAMAGWMGDHNFDTFSPGNPGFDGFWHSDLEKHASRQVSRNIAADLGPTDDRAFAEARETARIQAAVDGSPEADPNYLRESHVLSAYANIRAGHMTAGDLAAKRVDDLRGSVTGAEGTYHAPLVDQISKGSKPTIDDLNGLDQPKRVMGSQVRAPFVGDNALQRIANLGYAKVLDPLIAHLSRDPLFSNTSWDEYQGLKHFVTNGIMDEDTAMRLAETRATKTMLPKIHNTALRSQFSVMARNFMPFYFAQEQALKRAALLVSTHPNALRQYQLIGQGLSDPGFVNTDASGNRSFVFPASGVLGQVATFLQGGLFRDDVQYGLPMTMTGNLTSLNSVLPEFNPPGVSPFVSIPVNKLATMFPELNPEAKAILGRGFNQSALNALLPSPLVRGLSDYVDPSTANASFLNSWINSIASAAYHGQIPPPDASVQEQDAFMARMKNNTRSGVLVKTFAGLLSPLSPSVQAGDAAEQHFRSEFADLVKKQGIDKALQTFISEHGSKSVSYTIAHTAPDVHGSYIPETQQALDMINNNRDLINGKFATGAAWLVPQISASGDTQAIHQELLRQHLRQSRTPQQFIDAYNIAAGNAIVLPGFKKHQEFQAQHAGDSQSLAAENQNWSDYVAQQGYNNHTWHDYWTSSARTNEARQAYQDLTVLFSRAGQNVTLNGEHVAVPQLPNTAQTQKVASLYEDFLKHKIELSQFQSNFAGDSAGRKTAKANWAAYLDKKATSDPALAPVIYAVFNRLDTAGV